MVSQGNARRRGSYGRIVSYESLKTSNVELRNEIIRENGVLKSVRETVKAFEIASEGRQMMKSGEEVNRSYSEEGKGPLLPVLGKFTATLSREENEIAEPVYVVKGQGDTALLSSGAAERMGLVEYHLDLTSKHTHASHGGNSSRDS